MIQRFDLRDVVLSDGHVIVRPASKRDEALLLRWFPQEDAEGRCEVRVVDEFTIWPFIIAEGEAEAGFAQVWITTVGTGGLEFFIVPEFRRRGIATAVSRLLARHLRDDLRWQRITLEPHSDDAAAISCFTKAGFVDRGARRDDGDHTHIILEWT